MLSDLNGVVAACAVDKKLAVDVDGDVVNLHPSLTASVAATPVVGAVALAASCVLAGKEDDVARLKLRGVGEQNAHLLAFLRH